VTIANGKAPAPLIEKPIVTFRFIKNPAKSNSPRPRQNGDDPNNLQWSALNMSPENQALILIGATGQLVDTVVLLD
jgi:hypothetical protein